MNKNIKGMLKIEDYKIVSEMNVIVRKYKRLFDEIFELNKKITTIRNEFNEFVNKAKDPLGNDFNALELASKKMNDDMSKLIAEKDDLDKKIEDIRKEELVKMEEIKKMPNNEEIMKKVLSDNQTDLTVSDNVKK